MRPAPRILMLALLLLAVSFVLPAPARAQTLDWNRLDDPMYEALGLNLGLGSGVGLSYKYPVRWWLYAQATGGVWNNQNDTRHRISILAEETGIYSGYLWKCVAPLSWMENSRDLHLNQAYFLWEHTNFARQEAVAYNLDSLAHKEEYLRARHGDLVLIQKSSPLVPGKPEWSHEEIYDLLSGKAGPDI